MNILLGINTVLALFALFASTICILGWAWLKLLSGLARLLSPLVKEKERAKQQRRRPPIAQPVTKAAK